MPFSRKRATALAPPLPRSRTTAIGSPNKLFIARDNPPTLLADIGLHFAMRGEPDFREPLRLKHGRLESRAIWTSTALNNYLNFPHVGQVFVIERQRIDKKTGKTSTEVVYGVTDHTPESASPERLLAFNRDHWGMEAHHYILDWNWDEDRCRLHTGHGPENMTRLRRFAVGLIKANSDDSLPLPSTNSPDACAGSSTICS